MGAEAKTALPIPVGDAKLIRSMLRPYARDAATARDGYLALVADDDAAGT
jgi:hypothetical protein